jgi:mannose-6-phosphate isomerase-like protein (cupin superfamily)
MVVVEPGAGRPLSLGRDMFVLGGAALTAGAFSVLDQVVAPRLIVPPHLHERETQVSLVVSGTLGFWVDGDIAEVSAGGYVLRPAGHAHALWNPTDASARMLEITTPGAAFEEYMEAASALMDRGDASPGSIAALAAPYGIRFVDGPLADLCGRYGVSPAGGFWK